MWAAAGRYPPLPRGLLSLKKSSSRERRFWPARPGLRGQGHGRSPPCPAPPGRSWLFGGSGALGLPLPPRGSLAEPPAPGPSLGWGRGAEGGGLERHPTEGPSPSPQSEEEGGAPWPDGGPPPHPRTPALMDVTGVRLRGAAASALRDPVRTLPAESRLALLFCWGSPGTLAGQATPPGLQSPATGAGLRRRRLTGHLTVLPAGPVS